MTYRTLVELFYPTDPRILRRLQAGENLPMRERRMKHVPAGSIVDDIPAESVAGLLAAGRIAEVQE